MVGQVKGVSWVANGDGSPLAPSVVILMTLRGFPQEPIRSGGVRGVAKQGQTAVPERSIKRTVLKGMSRPAENLPPTARAIALLLSSAPSVQDAQPGVLHQLLEFSHRYTSQVLTDASVYAEHAGRGGKIEQDDVTLAVQARVGWEFGGRVPKEVCLCSRPSFINKRS